MTPIYPDDCRDPAVLAELAATAEQPKMAAVLIREGATVAQARERLNLLGTLGPMMAMVEHRPGISAEIKDRVLSGKLSIAQARSALFDAMADADQAAEVDNKPPTRGGEASGPALMRNSMLKLVEKNYGKAAADEARVKLQKDNRR